VDELIRRTEHLDFQFIQGSQDKCSRALRLIEKPNLPELAFEALCQVLQGLIDKPILALGSLPFTPSVLNGFGDYVRGMESRDWFDGQRIAECEITADDLIQERIYWIVEGHIHGCCGVGKRRPTE
jgi:hypothetical protein